MEYDLKTDLQGHVYFPKKIREMFGDRMIIVPGVDAAAVYPEGADLQFVISSLELIIRDLELRVKTKGQEATSRGTT